MPRLTGFSGPEVASILQKRFGFLFISQKGSHQKFRKTVTSRVITVIIPDHPELASGTLRNILRQAEINPKEFLS